MAGTPAPRIRTWSAPATPRGLALLLHGGREHSQAPVRPTQPGPLRMLPFAWRLAAAGRSRGLAVCTLEYRFRGWNGPLRSPVTDTRWALEQLRERFGDVPVALVGHSMGGRTAVWSADHPNVRAVAALAPWLPLGEPVERLADRSLLLVHGTADQITRPHETIAYAVQARPVAARVLQVLLAGGDHGMLRRPWLWHELTLEYVLSSLFAEPDQPGGAIDWAAAGTPDGCLL